MGIGHAAWYGVANLDGHVQLLGQLEKGVVVPMVSNSRWRTPGIPCLVPKEWHYCNILINVPPRILGGQKSLAIQRVVGWQEEDAKAMHKMVRVPHAAVG